MTSIPFNAPVPTEISGLMERARYEADNLTNGMPGSPDNVHRRGVLDCCVASLQALSSLEAAQATRETVRATSDLVTATKATIETTKRLIYVTWGVVIVTALVVVSNLALAYSTFLTIKK